MKKTKWIKSLGVVSALAMPTTIALTTMASCSRKMYTELVSEMKDSCIETFMDLSGKVHRDLWHEGEAFTYVRQKMISMGYQPSGYDKWSTIPEVIKQRQADTAPGQESFTDEYGNIWFDLSASAGYENVPGVIIHAHLDSQMVFSGGYDGDAYKQWLKSSYEGGCVPINYNQSDEILQTVGNTMSMGGDGGIGISVLLTIAKYDKRFNHGKIRLLFAAGESEAVSQAYGEGQGEVADYAAGYSFLERDQWNDGKAIGHEDGDSYLAEGSEKPFGDINNNEFKYIISAAGIVKNTIMVSSAGIHECAMHVDKSTEASKNLLLKDFNLPYKEDEHSKPSEYYYTSNIIDWDESIVEQSQTRSKHLYTLTIKGLNGGTSSLYINSGYGNALTMLFSIIKSGDPTMQLVDVWSNPSSAYAICNEAGVTFTSMYDISLWKMKMSAYLSGFKKLYPSEDWTKILQNVALEETPRETAKTKYFVGLSKNQSRGIIKLLGGDLDYGPIDWFDDEFKEVKTSINVGPLTVQFDQPVARPAPGTDGIATQLNFHVVERSADSDHLTIFFSLTHLLLREDLGALLEPSFGTDWEDKIVTHISNPVWAPPTTQKPNMLASAFTEAYNNFGLNSKTSKEHGWVEIACTPEMFINHNAEDHSPHMVLIGPDIIWNHSAYETIYTDTLTSVIETIVYVLDNSLSLLK